MRNETLPVDGVGPRSMPTLPSGRALHPRQTGGWWHHAFSRATCHFQATRKMAHSEVVTHFQAHPDPKHTLCADRLGDLDTFKQHVLLLSSDTQQHPPCHQPSGTHPRTEPATLEGSCFGAFQQPRRSSFVSDNLQTKKVCFSFQVKGSIFPRPAIHTVSLWKGAC